MFFFFISKVSIQIKNNNYSPITLKNCHNVNSEPIQTLPQLHDSTTEHVLIESFDFEGELYSFKAKIE